MQVAADALYRWKEVRLAMPPSITGDLSVKHESDGSDRGVRTQTPIRLTPICLLSCLVDAFEAAIALRNGRLQYCTCNCS